MYDAIARFYDLTHDALTDDLALILALAGQRSGRVLELGCGTGRLLLPLARAGHTAVGLDNSPAMLARARARLAREPEAVRARVTLVERDMALLEGLGAFGLVLIPYNTLLHLDPATQRRVLQQVRQVLVSDGRLLIDVENPFALLDLPTEADFAQEAQLTDPETGAAVAQWSRITVDAAAQQVTVAWRYLVGEDVVGETTAVYHVSFPHQLEMALREAGLRLVAQWGDYAQRPFAADSERLLLLAGVAE